MDAKNQPDYAYKTIEEYEKLVGFKVGEPFRIGWNMARMTNARFGFTSKSEPASEPAPEWLPMITRTDEATCKTCNGYGGLMHASRIDPTDGTPVTIQCPDCREEDDRP